MQSGFWVIPKFVFANLYMPVCYFMIIPVSSDPLNLETVEKKAKKIQKVKIQTSELKQEGQQKKKKKQKKRKKKVKTIKNTLKDIKIFSQYGIYINNDTKVAKGCG